MVFLRELPEDQCGGACDVAVMGESGTAFGDFDSSQLPGPLIDVAEQVAVDRLQVREIKVALSGVFES